MKTAYAYLKSHFDTMIMGGRRNIRPDGMESIRDAYEIGYGKKVHLFDIYRENISCPTNHISYIATLVGPPDKVDDMPSGIMVDRNNIVFTHVMSENYISSINSNTVSSYINEVYHAINSIIKYDTFYGNDREARNNMLVSVTRCLPFYITIHHIISIIERGCFSGNSDTFTEVAEKTFKDLLIKYIAGNDEDAEAILSSIINPSSKFSDEIDVIFSQMTCKNTLELFV